jgi:hypothetical protein
MSSSKKLTCKGDFAAGVYLSEAQNPIPLPLHMHCILVFSILNLFTKGESVDELERRGEGQQLTKLGRKYQHD